MHILILNQTFYPDVAATAQHMWDFAQHLVAKGHRVTALASRNVYGTDRAAFTPRETVNGVEIVRVGGTAYGKRSLLHRLADFASFYVAASWELARMPAPDVIVALTSPPMISSLGALACRFKRTSEGKRPRFVYYVMDVYPEAAVASGVFRRRGVVDRVFSWLTKRTLARADAIVALGRDMRDLLISHYGRKACGDKIVIVTPWADGKEIFPIPPDQNPLLSELGLRDTFNIVYSGNFGIAHDVTTITDAIELTRDEAGLCWVFIGGGTRMQQLKRQAAQKGWKNVRILPYQARERLNEALNLAHVHLISQLPKFTGIVVPSKLFGIMAAGKAAIMIGPAGCEVSRILTENQAGTVIANGDAQGLVAALRRLRNEASLTGELGANARKAFGQHCDLPIICERLERAICGFT